MFFKSLHNFCSGFQYPACPPLFLITFFRRRGMECDSSCNVVKGILAHASERRLLSCAMVFGSGSLYVFSSMIPQRFSTGLRSRELAGQSGFLIKFGKFRLHQFWVDFTLWAGAPSCTSVIFWFKLNSFRLIGISVFDLRLSNGLTSFSISG